MHKFLTLWSFTVLGLMFRMVSMAGAEHWAFAPLKAPDAAMTLAQGPRAVSPIDALVRAGLERRGLQPAGAADPRLLLRRLSFDLTGLPPSFEQSEEFARRLADDPERGSGVVAAVVDQLLASPAFGEKWARHWLDVARYADTKGYVFQEERRYPFAYSYRDWVIRAFNADMPYDHFLVAQIAADLIPDGAREDLAAMGYLTLGRRFLNREPDIIDDRIDVVTRGMLGLTVACARCHDHKFDPIPIEDYYSLYGVFQSSMEPGELPLVAEPGESAEYERFKVRLGELEQAVAEFKNARHAELLEAAAVGRYLAAAWDAREIDERELRQFAQDRKLYPAALERWRQFLFHSDQGKAPVFELWRAVASLGAGADAGRIREVIHQLAAPGAALRTFFDGRPLEDGAGVHAAIGQLLAESGDAGFRELLVHADGVAGLSPDALVRDYSVENRNEVRKRQRAVDRFRATDEGAPPRAMVLVDREAAIEPVVFERGNPGRPGARVPRQFLRVLSPANRKPFTNGSGRLELAQAIADPDNPLTPRVMANRVWMHLMGTPLVESPSDFGVRTPAPAVPGLLDHLAAYLVESGWSTKQLIRHIVLSETYQQSTDGGAAVAADPDNRLFARAARKRLPFESLRDALLTVSGSIDPRMFGKAVELEADPPANRRTIYGFIDRQNLPGVFRTFDFAGPDAHCPQRHETTVPQQALFLMNNGFAQEAAASLAALPVVEAAGGDDGARISAMYRASLSRSPSAEEMQISRRFVEDSLAEGMALSAVWNAFAQALLSSNEFAFCD